MAQLISEIWQGLRAAGMPEVMLYLPDLTASRCHWKDTTLIGETRVALLADQERQIVRILPVDSCVGIGIASPKGVDPSGYKTIVQQKLVSSFGGESEGAEHPPGAETEAETPTEATPAEVATPAPVEASASATAEVAPDPAPQPAAPEPPAPAKLESPAKTWASAPKQPPGGIRPHGTQNVFTARR